MALVALVARRAASKRRLYIFNICLRAAKSHSYTHIQTHTGIQMYVQAWVSQGRTVIAATKHGGTLQWHCNIASDCSSLWRGVYAAHCHLQQPTSHRVHTHANLYSMWVCMCGRKWSFGSGIQLAFDFCHAHTHMHTDTRTPSHKPKPKQLSIDESKGKGRAIKHCPLDCSTMLATGTHTAAVASTNLDTLVFLPLQMSLTALMHFHFASAKQKSEISLLQHWYSSVVSLMLRAVFLVFYANCCCCSLHTL